MENKLAIQRQELVKTSICYVVLKRLMDIIGALIGLILASPVMLIIAILIKIEDPKGPIFFSQVRNGEYPKTFKMYKFRSMIFFSQVRNGEYPRTFKMYKFRSMYVDAEERLHELMNLNEQSGPVFKIKDDPRITKVGKFIRKTSLDELPQLFNVLKGDMSLVGPNEQSGPVFKIKDDPRITKVGKFIRKTSLDELPQLFNVLKGDMSLVGPRPALPREVEQYTPYQMQRLLVKPGLTCIWQVSGRNNIGFDEWVELDIEYIKNRNLWLDIKLILLTIPAMLGDENAS